MSKMDAVNRRVDRGEFLFRAWIDTILALFLFAWICWTPGAQVAPCFVCGCLMGNAVGQWRTANRLPKA